MEPQGKRQPFPCFHLLVLIFLLSVVFSQQFDSFTEKVTFYPASLMVLSNIHAVLKFTDFGRHFSTSNNSCSVLKQKFFDEMLETVGRFQTAARRLLSLPGFLGPN